MRVRRLLASAFPGWVRLDLGLIASMGLLLSATLASTVVVATQAAVERSSAKEIYDSTNRAVLGLVKSTRPGRYIEHIGTGVVELDVRETVIEVKRMFAKDPDVKPGQLLTIRELSDFTAPLAEGETVMWFLASAGGDSFDSPVLGRAGDFRVTKTPEGQLVAVNGLFNRGFWRPDRSFWHSFDESFTSLVKKHLPSSDAARVRKAVDKGCEGKPVPIELLIALADAKMHSIREAAAR